MASSPTPMPRSSGGPLSHPDRNCLSRGLPRSPTSTTCRSGRRGASRVRPGYRGRGISHALLDGAVAYARAQGSPAIEGYPVDNQGKKVDVTMAYVGTRKLFEDAGFTKAADTDSVSGGFPRVVMRLDLR